MKRPFSYRNRQRVEPLESTELAPTEEPEPWSEEEEDAPEPPVAAKPKKKRKRKLAPEFVAHNPAEALALARWYNAPSGSAKVMLGVAAAEMARRRKNFRSGSVATCSCGTCLKCYNRQKQRESRARRKLA